MKTSLQKKTKASYKSKAKNICKKLWKNLETSESFRDIQTNVWHWMQVEKVQSSQILNCKEKVLEYCFIKFSSYIAKMIANSKFKKQEKM